MNTLRPMGINQINYIADQQTDNLTAFAKDCATVYNKLKAVHDKIIRLPPQERKKYGDYVDRVNLEHVELARKAGRYRFLKANPQSKEMTDFLEQALADLDRIMYPPKIRLNEARLTKAAFRGALSGATAALTTIASRRAFDLLGSPLSGAPKDIRIERVLEGASEKLADKITLSVQGDVILLSRFEWPGIFPFVVGLAEAAVGGVVMPFNPVVGGLLIADGASRVVQGIQENLEANYGGTGGGGNPIQPPAFKPADHPKPPKPPAHNPWAV